MPRTHEISSAQLLKAHAPASSRHNRDTPRPRALPAGELDFLNANLVGDLILPHDRRYEEARKVFNRRFDPRPSAIVYCAVERDVTLCIDALRRHRTEFRLRGGGNSFAGYSASDGVIVDVSRINDVSVDPQRRIATVGAGCSFAKLQAVLDDRRLHLPLGDAQGVSIGGFMQGGGFGLTSRTYGMNCDHVVEMRVMLADGRIVVANENRNHDLWWAVRGGTGGNFGVLLSVRYRLHQPPAQHRFCLGWRLSRDGDRDNAIAALMTLQRIVTRAAAAPRMNASATVTYIAERRNSAPQHPWLLIWGTYLGPESRMNRLLGPLLRNRGCWPQFDPALGIRHRQKLDRTSRLVSHPLAAEDWRSILSHFLAGSPNPQSTLQIDVWGGAIRSTPMESSAFIHRDALFNIGLTAWWNDERESRKASAFLSSWTDLVAPLANGEIYQNFPAADEFGYQNMYWRDALPALAAVKRKYDPDGLFDFPQAVRPAEIGAVNWPVKVAVWLKRPIAAER